jgi:ABC-2 type transport system ATP-binding protein
MKMLVGLVRPDSGSITIGGGVAGDVEVRRQIGFMPESPYFYDRLTGLEFMQFCGDLFNLPNDPARYEAILKSVDMFEARHWPIATYSKGMKQRLGFAQALVNDPQYIFLDEPLDGLDPLGRKEIKEIVKKLKHAGKTIFFNSHILYDTEELCDAIGVIDGGKLLYCGPVKEFTHGQPLETSFVKLIEERHKKAHL